MHPTTTVYRLADNPQDYAACHKIMRANGSVDWDLHWPTVVAVRDKEIIGFLSSNKVSWCQMAGPLELKKPSPFVVLRLIESYEYVMRYMGVTQYCFFIAKSNKHWMTQAEALGLRRIRENEENVFFERILSEPLRLAA